MPKVRPRILSAWVSCLLSVVVTVIVLLHSQGYTNEFLRVGTTMFGLFLSPTLTVLEFAMSSVAATYSTLWQFSLVWVALFTGRG